MRVFKLVNNIDLDNNNKEYNPAKVLIDLDNSNISKLFDSKKSFTQLPSAKAISTIVVCQIRTKNSNILDKLYILYIGSKLT